MAYAGYLIKIGDYEFPKQFIVYDSYKVIRSIQDIDSYRDANGVLHRNALPHNIYKVEFKTRQMTSDEYDVIMNNIRTRYVNQYERKVKISIYVPETGQYEIDADAYMPDPEVQIIQE